MKGPKDKSAAAQTYYGLLRFSRMFLAVAGIDLGKGLPALAQTNIDLAQRLLDQTHLLYLCLEPRSKEPDQRAWDSWIESVKGTLKFVRINGRDPVHAKACRFLEAVLTVRWGDHAAMLKGRLAPGAALGRGGAL